MSRTNPSGSGSGGGSMSSSSTTKNGCSTSRGSQPSESNLNTRLANLVAENAIIVVATRGCCMCLVVKHLLLGLGVNPTIFEVDAAEEATALEELSRIEGGGVQEKLPAVFVGGKLLGGVEKVMETHISGELVPLLKQAGALWL
ncbi:PREDICTED: glutaredoxin-C9-like [Nicotiana attenuata]|nr:PREDICTED: glutaredoxin-C9-like [Nicotiana attenuata]